MLELLFSQFLGAFTNQSQKVANNYAESLRLFLLMERHDSHRTDFRRISGLRDFWLKSDDMIFVTAGQNCRHFTRHTTKLYNTWPYWSITEAMISASFEWRSNTNFQQNSHFYVISTTIHYKTYFDMKKPIPVAARTKAWVCGRSLAGNAGSNRAGGMNICCCEGCVLSGRALCVGLITRPEASYRVWCIWV